MSPSAVTVVPARSSKDNTTSGKGQKRKNSKPPQNVSPRKRSRVLLEDESLEDEETNYHSAANMPSEDQGIRTTGDAFVINQEFARRFEHNKKREELQQRKPSL